MRRLRVNKRRIESAPRPNGTIYQRRTDLIRRLAGEVALRSGYQRALGKRPRSIPAFPAFVPYLKAEVTFGRDADLVLQMVARAREMQRKSRTLDPGNTFDIEVAQMFWQWHRKHVRPIHEKFDAQALISSLEESTERTVRRRDKRRGQYL